MRAEPPPSSNPESAWLADEAARRVKKPRTKSKNDRKGLEREITSRTFAAVVTRLVLSLGFGAGSSSAAPLDVAVYFSPGASNGLVGHGTSAYSLIVHPTNAPGASRSASGT
jgi:hypothetical protein